MSTYSFETTGSVYKPYSSSKQLAGDGQDAASEVWSLCTANNACFKMRQCSSNFRLLVVVPSSVEALSCRIPAPRCRHLPATQRVRSYKRQKKLHSREFDKFSSKYCLILSPGPARQSPSLDASVTPRPVQCSSVRIYGIQLISTRTSIASPFPSRSMFVSTNPTSHSSDERCMA